MATLLAWVVGHKLLLTGLLGLVGEIVTRKWPGAKPLLDQVSGLLDKVPGLENKE